MQAFFKNNTQALGKTFYNNLFGKYPQLRNQFNMSGQKNNAQASQLDYGSDQSRHLKYFPSIQGNSLANAVVAYCANCDQLEALGPTVAKYTVPTCKWAII